MITPASPFVRAASLDDVTRLGCLVAHVDGRTLALFADGDSVHAVDNRCPHMGFPLHRGTLQDGILTCHWHHARFDLATGGTFDQWADDVDVFPVEVRDGAVWVDVAGRGDPLEHHRQRVRDAEGAERCIVSAVRAGADDRVLADMLFAAATDHRYIRTGHVLDFTNKALECLDAAGLELAEPVLASLATEYAEADRMEESN